MICPLCHGRPAPFPCPECGGYGIISCCDGACGAAVESVGPSAIPIATPSPASPQDSIPHADHQATRLVHRRGLPSEP